ncbi:zinc-ribbon domain-containing protein [Caproiciproducens sp. LBM24188]
MGIFEDVVVNAKTAVNVVGKKAGQFVDISKLRISAADLNNEISKRFETLGRTIYEAKKTDNDSSELVNECITAIDDLYEQLDAVNEQIAAMREKQVCKGCGEENPQDAIYCNKCGRKLSEN